MYSVVLMMAMTSGGDVPVDGLLHRGGGCSGSCSGSMASCGCASSCYGGGACYGGGYGGGCSGSSCHGGHHMLGGGGGLFGGHRNSCHGGSSCSGSYAGACYGGGACYGSGYGGACYGSGSGGCTGGYVVPPMECREEKREEKKEEKKEEIKKPIGAVTEPTPATIVVSLPAEAKLMVDGAATMSKSAERTFVSPALMPGNLYHYTLKAEVQKDGQTMSVTKTIEVRAGMETRVTIDMSEAVASR